MNIGKLRHQITILAPVTNRNGYGENIQTWQPVACMRAMIGQLRGNLLTLAQARTSTALATHLITIRYNPTIRETHRVQYGPSIPQDFDTITSPTFNLINSSTFDTMISGTYMGPPPTIYTITSILDPDTTRRMMNLLCTVVKS